MFNRGTTTLLPPGFAGDEAPSLGPHPGEPEIQKPPKAGVKMGRPPPETQCSAPESTAVPAAMDSSHDPTITVHGAASAALHKAAPSAGCFGVGAQSDSAIPVCSLSSASRARS